MWSQWFAKEWNRKMWTNILNNVDYAEAYRENTISSFRYGKTSDKEMYAEQRIWRFGTILKTTSEPFTHITLCINIIVNLTVT